MWVVLMVVINEAYIIGAIAILLNSLLTGFAVYIGSHTGQRVMDNIKNHRSEKELEAENKERAEFKRLYHKYKDQVEIPLLVGEKNG